MNNRLIKRKRKKQQKREVFEFLVRILRVSIMVIVVSVVIVSILFIVLFRDKYSLNKPINSVVVYSNGISIFRYDPSYNELMSLNVNGDVYIEASGGLGSYPIKNIYTLSENEKKGEEMFKKTIMRNFHLPIFNVIDCRTTAFEKRSLIKLVLTCSKSGDINDILYFIYTKWKTGNNFVEKDINDYDGVVEDENGGGNLKLDENIFEKLELDFSQDLEIGDIVNVSIVTGESDNVPFYFNDVVKIMGGRIVEINDRGNDVMKLKSCKIVGMDKIFIKYIGKIFGCKEIRFSKKETDTKLYFSDEYLETF